MVGDKHTATPAAGEHDFVAAVIVDHPLAFPAIAAPLQKIRSTVRSFGVLKVGGPVGANPMQTIGRKK
ncbi:MAG: hypothetical protein QFF03_23790, partial [Pseudomonadota bacterium]|nr:hypothetical protein [Pseudomonadota bacterium]